jgi:Putative porin
MFNKKTTDARWGCVSLAVALCTVACVSPVLAQNSGGAGAPASQPATPSPASGSAPAAAGPGASGPATAPSSKSAAAKEPKVSDKKAAAPSAVVNLVNLLVKQGLIKEDQAQALIKEAEDEAYISQQANKDATAKADQAGKAATDAEAAANPPGTKHVTYVPEIVKQQLREEIKAEVMTQAQQQNWASPGTYPEWASRIHFYGDIRTRYQGNFFPSGNDKEDAINFNAINTGSPYLATEGNEYFPPSFDVSQNRNEFELRARLGMEADLNGGFSAGIRLASGNDSSPVSTNQTLGGNGNGTSTGNFSKYQAWLDRAYLRNEQVFGGTDLRLSLGRFDNPFWSPTDLVWYDELGFDGIALQGKYAFSDSFTPFAAIGAFPIYNTALNASINLADPTTGDTVDVPSKDRYLFGGQVGFGAQIDPQINARFAVSYYDFENVQGELSSLCSVVSASDVCDTDGLRPPFAQKGNTYMPLRNVIPDPTTGVLDNNYQYYGLAAQFRPLNVSGEFDFSHFAPVHVILDGDFVWNTALNHDAVNAVAVNNLSPLPSSAPPGSPDPWNGGDMGWMARLTVGYPQIQHFGNWNVFAAYKYLESDAVIDAFTDPDFGLGGTNLKGYIVGANFGVADNVWLRTRWMSATNIGGSPYAVDVVQVDLNAKF